MLTPGLGKWIPASRFIKLEAILLEAILLFLSTLAFLAGVVIIYWTHSQYQIEILVPSVPPPPPSPAPLISVIVPARDEERNIRRCVEALLAQSYPNFEVIVVDDRSTDATAQILAEIHKTAGEQPGKAAPLLRVLPGAELPLGWAGKPHALWQGAAVARGEWLCFVDADTFARPPMLTAALVTAQDYQADLFTILTEQKLGSFWEKAIMPVIFTALSVGFPAWRVNDPSRPEAIANGQFILIRRSVYTAMGGHQAVYNQIAEDKALAEQVKQRGYRLIIADGRGVAQTRMYTSLPEMWEGWTKNIFIGLQARLGLLLFGVLLGFAAALLLPLWLVGSLWWFAVSGSLLAAIVALQVILLWAYLLYLRSLAACAFNISPLYAFTLPLAAFIFTLMMLASSLKVLTRQGVTWKGRKYI